jgi:hypothetical protein
MKTQGKLKVRGKAGYPSHGIVDEQGKTVFTIYNTQERSAEERNDNAEFAVRAWNNHDKLVDSLRYAVMAFQAMGAPDAVVSKLKDALQEATS